jgi:hypothetical protein
MAKKNEIIVVLPNGSTVGLKDLGKVKPTPKPTVSKKPTGTGAMNGPQYDKYLQSIINALKKR